MNQTIFVVLDACQFDAAEKYCGFLEHMIDAKKGAKYKVKGELPSMSRPMYETLLTGLPAYRHGITNNDVCRLSNVNNIFKLCKENKKTTAAAAYYWNSELYNHAPFDKSKDRIQLNSKELIQNGIFYWEDSYPDSHLFADAEFLRTMYHPDFLLIHPMGVDYNGHKYGHGSSEYSWAIVNNDTILSNLIPLWMKEGYHIVITADHGMNEQGIHGGTDAIQRNVPLYLFSNKITCGRFEEELSQLSIAPLLLTLLELSHCEDMLSIAPIKLV